MACPKVGTENRMCGSSFKNSVYEIKPFFYTKRPGVRVRGPTVISDMEDVGFKDNTLSSMIV